MNTQPPISEVADLNGSAGFKTEATETAEGGQAAGDPTQTTLDEHADPSAGDLDPVDDAQHTALLDRIAASYPGQAENLRIQRHLTKTLAGTARVARREADARRVKRQALEAQRLERVRSLSEDAWKQTEALSRSHLDKADGLQEKLEATLKELALVAAQIGRTIDPKAQDLQAALQPPTANLAEVAARKGLADPDADRKALSHPMGITLMTCLVGLLNGVSLGLAAGMLSPDTLARSPIPVALCAAAGCGLALFTRKAIVGLHRLHGEKTHLNRKPEEVRAMLLTAVGFDATILFADMAVQSQGLNRWAAVVAQQNPKAPSPGLALLLVPLVVTLGYVAYSAFEGYLLGRRGPLLQAREAALAEENEALKKEWLGNQHVKKAFELCQTHRNLRAQQADHREFAESCAAPHRERGQKADAVLLAPLSTDHSAEDAALIAKAEREADQARSEFKTNLESLLQKIEPVRPQ